STKCLMVDITTKGTKGTKKGGGMNPIIFCFSRLSCLSWLNLAEGTDSCGLARQGTLPEAFQQVADAVDQVSACRVVGEPGGSVGDVGELLAEPGDGRQAERPGLGLGGGDIEPAGELLAVDAGGGPGQGVCLGLLGLA